MEQSPAPLVRFVTVDFDRGRIGLEVIRWADVPSKALDRGFGTLLGDVSFAGGSNDIAVPMAKSPAVLIRDALVEFEGRLTLDRVRE
ncbi:MAG: hypothetical protein ACI9PP_000481, partial [Halobacteriales archaeon]